MSCQVCRRDCGHRWVPKDDRHLLFKHERVVGKVEAESNGWSYQAAALGEDDIWTGPVYWKASLPDAITSLEALVAALGSRRSIG